MQIGIPAETVVGENRVAATPETVKKLISAGHSVVIERRAGVKAAYIDSAYEQVGATLTDDAYTGSQMILKVRAPQGAEIQKLAPNTDNPDELQNPWRLNFPDRWSLKLWIFYLVGHSTWRVSAANPRLSFLAKPLDLYGRYEVDIE